MPDSPALSFLVLMLTRRCNMACGYCYADAGPKGPDMPFETAIAALGRFSPQGRKMTVELTGGEPLLVFDLVKKIVLWTEEHHLPIRFALQTNGLLLDQAKLAFIRDHRIGLGLSLDGRPEVNQKTRGSDQKAALVLDLIGRVGLGVNVTAVITRDNVDRLPELVLFCSRFSAVRMINLDLVRPWGRARAADLAPSGIQLEKTAPGLVAALSYVNQNRFPPLKVREVDQAWRRSRTDPIPPYCFAAEGKAAAVTPKGDLFSCASLVDQPEFSAGTVNHPKPEGFSALIETCPLPEACRTCEVRFVCRGGCLSRRLAFGGRPDEPCELECALRRSLSRSLSS